MKYLLISLHDLNIAQTLNFLGYYRSSSAFKTSQPIDFLASIRFEVLQHVHNDSDIRVQVKYNEEILHIPWCRATDVGCEITEFLGEFRRRLVWGQGDMD